MTRTNSTSSILLCFFALLATTSLYAFDLTQQQQQSVPIMAPPIAIDKNPIPTTKYRRGRRILQQLFFPIRPLVRWSSKVLFHRRKRTQLQQQVRQQQRPGATQRHHCPSRTIQRFVDTVHSPFGGIVLRKLFPDHNKDGMVDAGELQSTLDRLQLPELAANASTIVADADKNGNGAIDLSEWLSETPRTLRAFCASSS